MLLPWNLAGRLPVERTVPLCYYGSKIHRTIAVAEKLPATATMSTATMSTRY